jgi:hypothetical protein
MPTSARTVWRQRGTLATSPVPSRTAGWIALRSEWPSASLQSSAEALVEQEIADAYLLSLLRYSYFMTTAEQAERMLNAIRGLHVCDADCARGCVLEGLDPISTCDRALIAGLHELAHA